MRVPDFPETILKSARRVTPSAHGNERRNTFGSLVEDTLEMFSPSCYVFDFSRIFWVLVRFTVGQCQWTDHFVCFFFVYV
jgi:hypothetical protein